MQVARPLAGVTTRRRTHPRTLAVHSVGYVLMTLVVIAFALPFLWMVSTSLKTLDQVGAYPPQIVPYPLAWGNYAEVFRDLPFLRFIGNSLFISALVVVGSLLSSSLAAYGFGRLRFPGRDVWFIVVLATMMLPFIVTLIPQYVIVYRIHLLNTYVPLILPAFFGNPFFIFLLRQFMLTIPREIDEAARIDGCGWWRVYQSLILPLCKPALAAVAIFAFVGSWQEFLTPLVYLNRQELFTVSLGIQLFSGQYQSYYNLMMAAALIALLPIIVVFLAAQRYFIQGVVLTGIKG